MLTYTTLELPRVPDEAIVPERGEGDHVRTTWSFGNRDRQPRGAVVVGSRKPVASKGTAENTGRWATGGAGVDRLIPLTTGTHK